MKRPGLLARFLAVAGATVVMLAGSTAGAAGLTGAIYTTTAACGQTNVNIFSSKDAVYLNGGPVGNGSGLPDGNYYVQVTEPNGTLLGTSLGSGNDTPVTVSGGEFVQCYRLAAILVQPPAMDPGYNTTSNNGGEYKVWVSSLSSFANNASKTDNFKVKGSPDEPPATTRLRVDKFYDANANGINDDAQAITGWEVHIRDGLDYYRYTPVDITVDPDDYVITESTPLETNWLRTTPNPVNITLAPDADTTVEFGNLCLGAGGGRTLGFWSNKNGASFFGNDDRLMLVALNLRNATGAHFDPASYSAFRTWLLSADASNMAYMLSAQLSAMELNVFNGLVSGSALVYAPGTGSANALGFATVGALMAEADAELGARGVVLAGNPFRPYQEALKNALDRANNNLTFVQASPCAFSFLPVV